jgi:hypothetical protein
MHNNSSESEYGKEFLNGVAKGLGAVAVPATLGFLHQTNIARSLFYGIFCCNYCKKTPEALEKKLQEKEQNETKLIAAENEQYGLFKTPFYPMGMPEDMRRRRREAQEEIKKDREQLEKYKKEDYPLTKERIEIKFKLL